MLESLTIFTKGGLVLYQYRSEPSLVGDESSEGTTTSASINRCISQIVLSSSAAKANKTYHIHEGLTFSWTYGGAADLVVFAVYPDIMFEGPRQYLKVWAETLLQKTAREYRLYYTALQKGQDPSECIIFHRPEPDNNTDAFDRTFRLLLEQSKSQQQQQQQAGAGAAGAAAAQQQQSKASSAGAKGKQGRQWHDGNAKVTKEAMQQLDMSADAGGASGDDMERALREARKTYLPSESELLEEAGGGASTTAASSDDGDGGGDDEAAASWSSSVTGMFQQLTGNKVLTEQDLEQPLEQMRQLLTQKNVATDIAAQLCDAVKLGLKGKKLNSMYRVRTAVRQAMERAVRKLLVDPKKEINLLRQVATKRGDGSIFQSIAGAAATASGSKKKPYVIVVMGINGIGKTTSLAKLAYYFKQNQCNPMLVAGDTFRSGAVEQLTTHANCLEVPIFSQGYSKDPSAVAKAAIQHATEQGNDVVLMDTAGRMQNNVPLMKALGKLVNENKPDCILLVEEALTGHDGLDQFQMFRKAISPRNVDGLLLTKYDTVSDKVGAALTLTHETGAPIVFVGTGQKYHHLKPLQVSGVIDGLFS